jgi:hypothetical protein
MPTSDHPPEPSSPPQPPATEAGGDRPDGDADAEADTGARQLLAGLNKVSAPPDLASRVPELIQRRSAGRFFAKRRLADRLPLEWLSLVMLALLALIYAILRMAPALLGSN